jgi:hypothetical protein
MSYVATKDSDQWIKVTDISTGSYRMIGNFAGGIESYSVSGETVAVKERGWSTVKVYCCRTGNHIRNIN